MREGSDTKDAYRKRFDDSEHLRKVLVTLHDAGADTWRTNPVANELMAHVIDRFARLARKYGLEPEDGGPAAWEAIRQPSICTADDPWATITKAVETTMAATACADDALCSVETARNGGLDGCWAERFGDRETPIWEHHPSFVVTDPHDEADDDGKPTIFDQAAAIAPLFTDCGWPTTTADAIEAIMHRLANAGSRQRAYESMRRDFQLPALTGLRRTQFNGLLRLLLGNPADGYGLTGRGKGILLRVALGESIESLAADPGLTFEIFDAAPEAPATARSRWSTLKEAA